MASRKESLARHLARMTGAPMVPVKAAVMALSKVALQGRQMDSLKAVSRVVSKVASMEFL